MLDVKRGFALICMVALCLAAIVLLFFYLPQRRASSRIEAAASGVGSLASQVNTANESLSGVEPPNTITPGSLGATAEYLQLLTTASSQVGTGDMTMPMVTPNPLRRSKVRAYNDTVSSDEFKRAVNKASASLAQTKTTLDYQLETMRALKNVLEYEPGVDLAVDDSAALLASLQAVSAGVAQTDELLRAQIYAEDPYLNELREMLAGLEVTRAAYQSAVESGRRRGVEYKEFVDAVSLLQQNIIRNRQAFWDTSSPKLGSNLQEASEVLTLQRSKLSNLR